MYTIGFDLKAHGLHKTTEDNYVPAIVPLTLIGELN